MQQIIVGSVFLVALFYVGRLIYKSFQAKASGCATGCGKCGAVDFEKIEAQIKKEQARI
ncbi:FeoB-associated Cys-rich membrane protein [Chryseolinea sp. Jin1]|uniref:FeoB-associated Cys-rich membrane protein n=1 Tax=Chryseolinea lacunae TaxID=2801331 RepID=A0ABS1KVR6_9BACT|nr:FeoB-associated Cys-rich membrane protein [Chryseolinea lacunae]